MRQSFLDSRRVKNSGKSSVTLGSIDSKTSPKPLGLNSFNFSRQRNPSVKKLPGLGSKMKKLPKMKRYNSQPVINSAQRRAPIMPELGSLSKFLNLEEFESERQANCATLKCVKEEMQVKQTKKLYITMNEVLQDNQENKGRPKAGVSVQSSERVESKSSDDPIQIILHDKHPINRKNAIKRLSDMIEAEIRVNVEQKPKVEIETESESELEEEDDLPDMNIDTLKKRLEKFNGIAEKLNKFDKMSEAYYGRKNINDAVQYRKKGVWFRPEEIEAEPDSPTGSAEQFRSSKSGSDKRERTEMMMSQPIHDIFKAPTARKISYISLVLPTVVPSILRLFQQLNEMDKEEIQNRLQTIYNKREILEGRSKQQTRKQQAVVLNKWRLCVPNCEIGKSTMLYIFKTYAHWQTLQVLDLSKNPIGNDIATALVHYISETSNDLTYLDLSGTRSELHTAMQVRQLLQNTELNTLKMSNNRLGDQGVAQICLGALESNLNCLELAYTGIAYEGALIISKVIRLNRTIRSLNISGSEPGAAISEIGRACIVNPSIRSLILNSCKLVHIREIAYWIGVSRSLMQLSLCDNQLDAEAIQMIEQNLSRVQYLNHLGLSGNPIITMATIEKLQASCPPHVKVEISKEEDYLNSADSKRLALYHYTN